jgi:uncharacterized protein
MEVWTAFLVGLGGSFHCAGMCGPLVLALPAGGQRGWELAIGRLLYSAGRVATYSLLGGVFGLAGGVVRIAGLQQALSIAVGAGVVLAALAPRVAGRRVALPVPGIAPVRAALSRLLRTRTRLSLPLIGLLNGLLPCGLVYLGLAGSLATGSALGGMAYMALFGLGTVPLLLAVSLSGPLFGPGPRRLAGRLLPAGMVVLGLLFVLRGMGLGIPYLSPLPGAGAAGHCCPVR